MADRFDELPRGAWSILPDRLPSAAAASKPAARPPRVERTASVVVVDIAGVFMADAADAERFGGVHTAAVARTFRELTAADEVDGVLVMLDSPGGQVAGMAEAVNALRVLAATRPTDVFAADLVASGAYWLASQARRITVGRTALVGSIGTYTYVIDYSRMAEAAGITVHVVRAGEMKAVGFPGAPVTDDQLAELQRVTNALNRHFVEDFARGRGLPMPAAEALADGRLHVGGEAVRLGLADAVGELPTALAGVADAAYAFARRARSLLASAKLGTLPAVERRRIGTAQLTRHGVPALAAARLVEEHLEVLK